ncbi:MAG: DUF1045 domain-containing protein [Paracoccaceae bacterium]|nr:DUF1045 domain-containing protein [Paracoccaceae bacterium]
MNFTRYGIYFTPRSGAFSDAGSAWLGWDLINGQVGEMHDNDITARPRKYGFHGTIKPPFSLNAGTHEADLKMAIIDLCATLEPVALEGLTLSRIGSFLALTPVGDVRELGRMAARVVQELDHFRAPANADEIARRKSAKLTPLQEENLRKWGYPYVMEAFKFHMTLTGPLPNALVGKVTADANAHFADLPPRPFLIDSLTLVGEAEDGMFREIQRYTLSRK